MSLRVDVDETLPLVAIPGRVLHELSQHARDTLPEECCGLIIGDEHERFARLVRCHNDMNQRHHEDPVAFPRDAKSAFWMRATDYQRAQEEAEATGQEITAVYHSHTGVNAYLSDEDLAYAEHEGFPFKGADQIVVAVPGAEMKPRVALFRREKPGRPFRGHEVQDPSA